jgi:hypothetical protein
VSTETEKAMDRGIILNGAAFHRPDACGWAEDSKHLMSGGPHPDGGFWLPTNACGATATFEFDSVHNTYGPYRVCDEHAELVRAWKMEHVKGEIRPPTPSIA